jgi:predicted outer membrane repeat protein
MTTKYERFFQSTGTAIIRACADRLCDKKRLVGALIAVMFLAGGSAKATTITVNSLADPGAQGSCALRDAINAALTGVAQNDCPGGSGDDVIQFSVTGTINLTSALPAFLRTVTVNGPSVLPGITINGAGVAPYEVFVLASAETNVVLNNLTITNASSSYGGAAINDENGGQLSVVNCTFTNNTSPQGGAIWVSYADGGSGSVNVINSTFSGNSATQGFYGNGTGGAIYVEGFNFIGSVNVINSTFSGNSSANGGGAIYNGATSNSGIVLNVEGTILAGSSGGNCAGTAVTDQGYNLSDDGSCGLSATGSENNVSDALLNLGPLQNNGGPTETIALRSGSVAINVIPVAQCTYQNVNPCTNPPASSTSGPLTCDQRGELRPSPG